MQNNILPYINIELAIQAILKQWYEIPDILSAEEIKKQFCTQKIIMSFMKIRHSECFSVQKTPQIAFELYLLGLIYRKYPDIILPGFTYLEEGLDETVIEILCKKLQQQKLRATRSIVQQMAWKAYDIFIKREDIENIEHAIHIVIKTYKNGWWRLPHGMPEKFICNDL